MKKLWDQYSYAIILVILSCLAAFFIAFKYDGTNTEKFMKVTVADGDSIWEIAESYSEQHGMSQKQFVQWVKKNNKIEDNRIFPGEELVIPVMKEVPGTQLAGVMNE